MQLQIIIVRSTDSEPSNKFARRQFSD